MSFSPGWRPTYEGLADLLSLAAPETWDAPSLCASWPVRHVIDVVGVAEGRVVKNRLHLDLRADSVATPDELERLLRLGARRMDVGQAPDVSWVVLADPEGNEFCLLSRSVQEV